MKQTRRTLLRALGGIGIVGLAGCSGEGGEEESADNGGAVGTTESASSSPEPQPPTADEQLYLGHSVDAIDAGIMSGGVPKDGIPSIDEPKFTSAAEAQLNPGDPVFGAVRDGVAKAYPQNILVHHEIVNDTLAGDSVAITYCPLTGTAQGFERGPVEFGVSGNLANSNLVMYDRGTNTWWPQVVATGVRGDLKGESLQEFRVVWTTWKRWRTAFPDTEILSTETGFSRRYSSDGDPYGQYNPDRGYYTSNRTIFPPLNKDNRNSPKKVVIGTRTEDGALTFDKAGLLEKRVLTGSIGDTEYVAVAEQELATGYVYANPDGMTVRAAGDGYTVDGETYSAADLPLTRSLAFDGMWFAWAGFYPEVDYVS